MMLTRPRRTTEAKKNNQRMLDRLHFGISTKLSETSTLDICPGSGPDDQCYPQAPGRNTSHAFVRAKQK